MESTTAVPGDYKFRCCEAEMCAHYTDLVDVVELKFCFYWDPNTSFCHDKRVCDRLTGSNAEIYDFLEEVYIHVPHFYLEGIWYFNTWSRVKSAVQCVAFMPWLTWESGRPGLFGTGALSLPVTGQMLYSCATQKLRVHLLCLLEPSLLHGDIELQKSLRLILAPGSGYEEIFISKLIKQSSKLIKVISRFITQPSTVIQNLEEEDDTGLDISPPVPRPVSLVH